MINIYNPVWFGYRKNAQAGTEKGDALRASSSHPNLSSHGPDSKVLQKGTSSFLSILPTMNETNDRNDLSFEDESGSPSDEKGERSF